MPSINDPTPRTAASNTVRIVGTLAVAALVLAIILLALGVVDFEQSGWFN
jgi:hypothetical protein